MGTTDKKIALTRELGDILRDLSKQKPIVEGPMFKQSKTFHNTFYKRYFILHKNYLLYYPHERDYKKDSTLQRCTVVKLNGLYLTRPTSCPVGVKHYFLLHTPDPANLRKEMMLATSNRKGKNIWMELLQEQNPTLLPSASKKSKPPYIRRMRLENAVHPHRTLVPTVSYPVSPTSPTTRSHPHIQRSMSTPNKQISRELHPQLIRSDSFNSDRPTCTTISENTEAPSFNSTSPMTPLTPLTSLTPVKPPEPVIGEHETLSISSFGSDTS